MSDYDNEIEEAFNKFIANALSATETESQGRYILGMTDEYRECFEAGAKYQKEKDAERIKGLKIEIYEHEKRLRRIQQEINDCFNKEASEG
jgi:hypothetical protein